MKTVGLFVIGMTFAVFSSHADGMSARAKIAGSLSVQAEEILGGTSDRGGGGIIEILDRDKPFSTTEEKQLEEVQKDPMFLRFKETRALKKENPLTPIYHLTSPAGNDIQDPVAFCYWNGRYHMFYMIWVHDLKTGERLTDYWGHYVSKDLVHWEDYPIGFYQPNNNIKGNKCFAGSAFAEKDRVLAIMMSTGEGAQVFESRDPLLLNWKKIPDYEKNGVSIPSVGADAMGNPYRVWDPFLFKDGGKYYTLCGVFTGLGGKENEPKRRAVWHLFESKDLEKWDFIGNLLENDPFTPDGEDGSCSYLWPLGNKYLPTFFSHNSGTQHFLGEYNSKTKKFIPESHALQHAGPSTSLPDPTSKGKIIIVNNCGGAYSMPRRFSLGKFDTVLVEPAGDMSLLHGKDKSFLSSGADPGHDPAPGSR